jgi:hypothetical protein
MEGIELELDESVLVDVCAIESGHLHGQVVV